MIDTGAGEVSSSDPQEGSGRPATGSRSKPTDQRRPRAGVAATAEKAGSTQDKHIAPEVSNTPVGGRPKPKPKPRTKSTPKAANPEGGSTEEEPLVLTDRACKALKKKVAEAPEGRRMSMIHEYNALDDFEMDRENNKARLDEALRNIGPPPWAKPQQAPTSIPSTTTNNATPTTVLNEHDTSQTSPSGMAAQECEDTPEFVPDIISTSFAGDVSAPSSPSSRARSTSSESTGVSRLPLHVSSASESSFLLGGTNAGFVAEAAADASAQQRTSPTLDSSNPLSALDRSSWPDWLKDQFEVFEGVNVSDAHAGQWRALLREWALLEESLEFKGPRIGFSPKHRPAEISLWIKNARSGPIVITNPEKYTKQYKSWWDKINPTWRVRNGENLTRGGDGDWSSMTIGSTNGFLNVIAGLVALRDTVGVEEWREAMEDVLWVLQGVRQQRSQRG
ncbi:hypothetical protein EIP86_010299, partial [Pleurotus ostreatoroseus]